MARKSRMVKEGRAHKRAVAAQAQAELEQQRQEWVQGRMRLAEILSPDVRGISRDENPALPTLEEVRAGTFPGTAEAMMAGTPYVSDPRFFGRENLLHFYDHWEKEWQMLRKWLGDIECKVRTNSRQWNGLMRERDRLRAQKERLKMVQLYLSSLTSLAEEKPLFAGCRKREHFEDVSQVICLIPNEERFRALKRFTLMPGVITRETREQYICWQNGHPVVRFEERVLEEVPVSGKTAEASFDARSCNIMRPDEYEYLVDHPDYRRVWLQEGRIEVDAVWPRIYLPEINREWF